MLRYQHEWAGFVLVNKRTLVCPKCLDTPNETLRSLILPPDPLPVINARPEQYSIDEGPMPLTTEGARTGDPGSVIRDDTGHYLGQDPPPQNPPSE